jgi:hypothetical protein
MSLNTLSAARPASQFDAVLLPVRDIDLRHRRHPSATDRGRQPTLDNSFRLTRRIPEFGEQSVRRFFLSPHMRPLPLPKYHLKQPYYPTQKPYCN